MNSQKLEERLTEEFQRQAEAVVVPPPDPRSVLVMRSDARDASAGGRFRGPAALAFLTALFVLAAGAVVVVAMSSSVSTGPAAESDRVFVFDTQVGVRLQASDFTVDVAGRTFTPSGETLEVHGDPGNPASPSEEGYTTLELTWFEHDVEMRVNLYFASAGNEWWINEIRTYNGAKEGEWITMTGEYAKTPLGQPFEGVLEEGALSISGLTLEGFKARASSCDGTAQTGRLLLEFSGPGPIAGTSGEISGYATTLTVLDAATCEPVDADGVEFRGSTADTGVAVVDEGPESSADRPPGELYVSVTFTGPGETVLTVEAIDQQTGQLMATLNIPVTVNQG